MPPKTLIICPVWGAWEWVEKALKSVRENTLPDHYDFALIINPNPQEDEELRARLDVATIEHAYYAMADLLPHDDIEVFFMPQAINKGVAPSWNLGIRHGMRSKEQFYDSYLLLNSDVEVWPMWLANMRHVMRTSRSPKDPSIKPFCIQTELTEGGNPDHFEIIVAQRNSRAPLARPAHGINGPCFMLTRECIDAVGLFDERFIIGFYEDSDYLIRMRARRQTPIVSTRAYVHHHHAKSRSSIPHWHALQEMNKNRFERKHAVCLGGAFDAKSFPTIDQLRQQYGYVVG